MKRFLSLLAALCGNQEAVEFCEHFKLNYNPVRK
jgi:hypothetical protein